MKSPLRPVNHYTPAGCGKPGAKATVAVDLVAAGHKTAQSARRRFARAAQTSESASGGMEKVSLAVA